MNKESKFADIKPLISARFEVMKLGKIFNVDYSRDEIVEKYLGAFPTPEMRQEHNCSACKRFLRQVGGMVVIEDGVISTLWDNLGPVPEFLQASVDALAAYVKSRPIIDLFFSNMPSAGVDKNADLELGVIWEHFYLKIPKQMVNDKNNTLGKASAEMRETKNVLKRGLDELKIDDLDAVLELIAQKSIYRGNEHEASLRNFRAWMAQYAKVPADRRDAFCWDLAAKSSAGFCRMRNTSIGTLLVALAEES